MTFLACTILYAFLISGLLIFRSGALSEFFEDRVKSLGNSAFAFLMILVLLADVAALVYIFGWAVKELAS